MYYTSLNIFVDNSSSLRQYLFILIFFSGFAAAAQTNSAIQTDSVVQNNSFVKADSLRNNADSGAVMDTAKFIQPPISFRRFDTALFSHHPFFRFDHPIRMLMPRKQWEGKETFFYIVLLLLIFFALVKNGFRRYLQDLSKLFFRTTIKQRQVKEQLMQSPLPTLLLNVLFIMAGAFYLSLVFEHYNLGASYSFWVLIIYCAVGLTVIYSIKFITLKLCGWLFGLSEATDAYIFIVFTTNRILGIVLLPLIVLLAFTAGSINQAVLTVSLILLGLIFLYRFFLSYLTIHRQVEIGFFHFFLYLWAFEIAPLLLINKLLFLFLS